MGIKIKKLCNVESVMCKIFVVLFCLSLHITHYTLHNCSAQDTETQNYSQDNTASFDQAASGEKNQLYSENNLPAQHLSSEELSEGVKINKESISLDLKGIDVNELFRILALKMGLTIVPSKSVGGRLNIFLNNLSFQDALDVILISQDLASERKGNIINIMTAAEYERLYGKRYNEKREVKSLRLDYAKPASVLNALAQIKSDIGKIIVDETSGTVLLIDIPEKLELMEKAVNDLDQPLQAEIFDLKYSKPADIKTHLSTAITAGPGELFVDERSNKVMVSDLPEKMKKLKRMVKAFDEESQQVFIEAEIVQVTLKNEYQRGINWEKICSQKHLDDLDITGKFPVDKAISFTPSPAAADAALKMVVGKLSRDNYVSTLQILQTFGDVKILSRPRIAALNNQEAKILVGSREAYITSTQSQAETTTITAENVEFIDVGVKFNVVPTINKDGFVTMKLKPEVSSVKETLTTTAGSRIPIVETSEAETIVKVRDGTTIMIAGLIKTDKRTDKAGMPILSQIPIIGGLFGSHAGLNKKTELIVFLTPHIITGETAFAGTEIENMLPPDIVPEDIEKKIISQKIENLKTHPQQQTKSTQTPQREDKQTTDIQKRIKGIKEY